MRIYEGRANVRDQTKEETKKKLNHPPPKEKSLRRAQVNKKVFFSSVR